MTNSQRSQPPSIDTIVAIPVLNEAAHIKAVIAALSADEAAMARAELWVVDGGSADATERIVRAMMTSNRNLRWIHNPDKIQACAVNLAALEARRLGGVTFLVRADAHARYPANWISRLIAAAEEMSADSVVVPMKTCGGGAMRDASADLFNSWLGNGGSAHRSGTVRGFVEHGHHALFRLDAFLEAGGYDPRFLANEDAELDVRLVNSGRRIFLENRAAIDYFPRATLKGVFRQFHRNGRYRLCTSLKHGRSLGLRQLAPIALSAGVAFSLTGGLFLHPLFAAPAAFYAAVVIIAACAIASRKTPQRIALIAVTAMTAHLAFGFGALSTILTWALSNSLPLPPEQSAQS
ncbi:MAG: glycosyltransferase family 2 protein [Amphiplicatus sp.]